VRYFLRDDDVGPLTPALRHFVETFATRQLPVSYQVIPARLTAECADFLVQAKRAHPGLIEFGQHGLKHEMTLGARRLKREFGPERTRRDQQSDIEEGLHILRERLGAAGPIRVFTPPQHKFDANTVAAAAAAGLQVFSASSYPSVHHQLAYAFGRSVGLSSLRHHGISYHGRMRPEGALFELSISIDVDDGRRRKYKAADLGPALHAAAARTNLVGLMLHHELYADAEARAELEALADQLADMGALRFSLLTELAFQRVSASMRPVV
jgi:hypothetical protein